ncbi:MAG TPA: DUF6178 family protein [Kofleriaceae bacterium]|nr:DUF6178 family protein [Kofleriaceae bacterium]
MTKKDERGGERADIIPLSRFRAGLARPRGVRRMEALLEAPDPAAAVAALSLPEFYFLVKEVGLGDSAELVALATPEQVRGCLDMEIWDRDRMQLDAAVPWLLALAEAGFEKLAQVWEQIDPELRALILARTTRIYDRSLEEEPDEDEERPMFTSPDSFFTVVITAEREDEIRLVHQIIDDLFRADMQLARHTLMAARSELTAELEEMSYRWRAARMADLGYVDFYEALEVFRPIDPETIQIGEQTADRTVASDEPGAGGGLPAPVIEPMSGTFLARALEQVTDAAEAERLEAALIYLVNRVLSASRVTPGDEEAVRLGSLRAAATTSLGLEHLCAGRVERAPAALATVSLTRLHRLGHTLTLRLGRMARLLAPRAITAGEPSGAVLESLLRARPLYAAVLDDPEAAGGVRPFQSLHDLRRAAEHLTELAARIALADALGVDLLAMKQVPEPRPELDDHARTALARMLGGGELDAAPLEPAELDAIARRLAPAGRLGEEARARALRAIGVLATTHRIALPPAILSRLVDGWLARLEDELGGLAAGQPIDPAMVGGVITSAHKT